MHDTTGGYVPCSYCEGAGGGEADEDVRGVHTTRYVQCWACDGEGQQPLLNRFDDEEEP